MSTVEKSAPHRSKKPLPRWRYLPLIILLVLVLALTGIGLWSRSQPLGGQTESVQPITSATVDPRTCLSDRTSSQSHPQPWAGAAREQSEASWIGATALKTAPNYLESESEWYFFGDAYVSNASQMVGRVVPNQQQTAQFRKRFTELDSQLRAEGRQLALVVAPAKWDVYRDQTPEWSQALVGETTIDVLQQATPELVWIDPRDALRDAEYRTYTPTNSHWTDYGGYVGWSFIASCIAQFDEEFGAIEAPPIVGVTTIADTGKNEFAAYGIADAGEVWTQPVFDTSFPDLELSQADGTVKQVPWNHKTDMMDFPLTVTNPAPQVDKNVLLAGDSMSTAISPYLARSFKSVRSIRHGIGETPFPDIVAEARAMDADLVIIEVAERHYLNAWR